MLSTAYSFILQTILAPMFFTVYKVSDTFKILTRIPVLLRIAT